ncbi:MAG: hypothetical protein A2X64_10240 [Ignavibacteria bacterium GWF2_33_9]|nr:MAG: hypothetical protein A2X64_10240 [Ignavibacteria bacterium GWF2_33_9]
MFGDTSILGINVKMPLYLLIEEVKMISVKNKIKNPRFTSWVILFLFASIVNSKAENPEWILYNTENSPLPSNFIWDVEIDSTGNKWIATGDGLAKFDGGTTWTIYTKENAGLPSSSVKTIAIDSKNNKWIGFYTKGLAKLDDQNWTYYNTSNSQLCDNQTSIISIDKNDNIYIGTKFGGVSKFDDYSNWVTYDSTYCPMKSQYITGIDFDIDGNTWITTTSELIKVYGQDSWQLYNSSNSLLPKNKFLNSLKIDKNGFVYLGLTKLFTFDRDTTWTVYKDNSFYTRDIMDIDFDINNNIWLSLEVPMGGLAYSSDLINWTGIDTLNSPLPNDNVYSLAIDNYGNKWIGTYGGGLAVYRKGGVVGVKDIISNYNSDLQFYPNPVFSTFSLSQIPEGSVKFEIFDIFGNRVLSVEIMHESSLQNIDVSFLPAGIYFLKFNNQSKPIKFMKIE